MGSKKNAIAVVGMSCRLPKDLDSVDRLWEGLLKKYNACGPVPQDRWDAQKYVSDNDASKGKTRIKTGNFLSQDIAGFDASFFGISPRDAENMDPQQRILLELVWEAFENAGMPLRDYARKQVGVYVGGFMLDHMITQMAQPNRSQINQNTASGMMMTMLSNRLSHVFDFRGPSLSIDTACSSSLVAFHYGCQDVWSGNCEVAVVGGINVMSRPEYPIGMSKGHFLSPDGQCKSFDERADGYGRGEGGGVVLLKPLEAAIEAGDPIWATVIGTGANQDGHTPGISMPSGEAQEALIRDVWQRYEIDPSSVRYVECHGTGTAIGDPTECGAIGRTYGKARQDMDLSPVVVGSIKSNIGHLEAAAGVAGVIKSVLTLMHRKASPLGNLETPNSNIPFKELGVRISDVEIPLAKPEDSFCVAVNSFGYGGTNAHAVLKSSPVLSVEMDSEEGNGVTRDVTEALGLNRDSSIPFMLPLSATSKDALKTSAKNLYHSIQGGLPLRDVLHTAAERRSHLEIRAVASGDIQEELLKSLLAIAEGTESEKVVKDTRPFGGRDLPVYVFTGMGPQWWGMGQELYRSSCVYKSIVEKADSIFQEVSGFSILKEMLKGESESKITKTELAQPGNLLVQLGLFHMMQEAGAVPGAVVGHSVGELGSAYASGILSLEDCITVSYHRSQLQAKTAGLGGMLAVGMGAEQVKEWIAGNESKIDIAAVNSPSTVTLAGDIGLLANLEKRLTDQEIFARMLDVEVPYHSHLMDPLMDPLKEALKGVNTNQPTIPVYSTVTGQAASERDFGADYWPKNIRQSVEFSKAVETILNDGYNTFVEIGPHPVLSASLRDCIKTAGVDARLVHTLRRKKPESLNVHRSVMGVHCAGCQINWKKLTPKGNLAPLPNYPWQRETLWMENDRAKLIRIAPIVHPMLGNQEALAAPVWRGDFDHQSVNYLRDHVVSGLPLLPAAGYIETLLELASSQFADEGHVCVRELEIGAPMVITADRGADYTTTYDSGSQLAIIRSLENGRLGNAQVHVQAKIGCHDDHSAATIDLHQTRKRMEQSIDVDLFYRQLNEIGLSYGPAFRTVKELSIDPIDGAMLCKVSLAEECQENHEKYLVHPTLLDGCFHSLMALLDTSTHTFLPTGVENFSMLVDRFPSEFYCVGKLAKKTAKYIETDLSFYDQDGKELGFLKALRTTATKRTTRTDQFGDPCKLQVLDYLWDQGPTLSEPKRLGHWLVFGPDSEAKDFVVNRLESFGALILADVEAGEGFQVDGRKRVVNNREDYLKVIQDCGVLDGVVFLGSDPGADSVGSECAAEVTGEKSLSHLVLLTQALLKFREDSTPRVFVATSGAFSVDNHDREVMPSQTALNGFVRVASNELEGFRFTTLDIPANPDEESLEMLVLELVCDGDEDEVAIRGESRLVSQINEIDLLSADRVQEDVFTSSHSVAIRPLREGQESSGSVRLLEYDMPKAEAGEILLQVDSVLTPPELVSDQLSDKIDRPFVEVIGRVVSGCEGSGLANGTRVCGLAPADLRSHLCGPTESFHLVSVPDHVSDTDLLGSVGDLARAIYLVEASGIQAGARALVDWSGAISLFLVCELVRRDVKVSVLCQADEQEKIGGWMSDAVGQRCRWINRTSVELRKELDEHKSFGGFDLLAADVDGFEKSFGFEVLKAGGTAIDCNDSGTISGAPKKCGRWLSADLALMTASRVQFSSALEQAVDQLVHQEVVPLRTLDVTVADISLQILPLADATIPVVITFKSGGQPLPLIQQGRLSLDPEGSYIVTGGFGGFGMKTALWLADHGAGRVVLTGRTGADSQQRKAFVREVEKLGTEVSVIVCDVSDLDATKAMVQQVQSNGWNLKGVFHSAAVIHDQAIDEIDIDLFRLVMRSKATGAWNLHMATKEIPLDHFVMYSSLANMVGNSRQSAYCAANGFLNGLAKLRQKEGLPALSANWGAISDVGIVTRDEKLEQFLKHVGLRGIPSSEALDLLEIALVRNVNLFGLVLITSWKDWSRFETLGAKSYRFAKMIEADSTGQDSAFLDELKGELDGMPHGDRLEVVAGLMQEITASVLKADPEDVSIDRPINELGIDSLMAVEMQLNFDGHLGFKVSVLELLGQVTLRGLAAKALDQIFGSVGQESGSAEQPGNAVEPEVEAVK